MRAFGIWIAGLVVVFGIFVVVTNVVRDTKRIFVLVDSSFPMEEVWRQVPGELDAIDDRRYAEFALATEKSLIHTWEDRLTLGAVSPFAPCDFDDVASYGEIADADERILITTAGSCSTDAFTDWEIILLDGS